MRRIDQEVADASGSRTRLLGTPGGDRRMVARKQDVRNIHTPPTRRLRIGRRLEQTARTFGERVVDHGLRVAQHAWDQPGDRFDDDQHCNLATGQDVVTEADFLDSHSLARVLGHTRVDALVAAAGEDQPRLGGEFGRDRLGERAPSGSGDD